MYPKILFFLALAAFHFMPHFSQAQTGSTGSDSPAFNPQLQVYGAFRPVFTTVSTTERDGSSGNVSAINARLHLGSRLTFTPDFYLQARLAVRGT